MNAQHFSQLLLSKKGLIAGTVLIALAGSLVFWNLNANKRPIATLDTSFSAYVSAYTAGVISKTSPIRIQLTQEVADSGKIGMPTEKALFKLSPDVPGKAFYADTRTIEFRPDNHLASGKEYVVSFNLGKVVEVPSAMATLQYSLRTMPQNFQVAVEGLSPMERLKPERQKLTGTLHTADLADASDVEKLLMATQGSSKLEIAWEHQPVLRQHQFAVLNIQRGEQASEVSLNWSGNALGINYQDGETITVPSIKDFVLVSAQVIQSPSQYVSLRFSDPLDEKQNLQGLIQLSGLSNLRFQVQDNEVLIFPAIRQNGKTTLTLNPGITNLRGFKFSKIQQKDLSFAQAKPEVRFLGKGTILPGDQNWIIPFEAIGLKAVDVRITQVYEKNIAQFLQINTLGSNMEMKRVGRPVAAKTVPLGSLSDVAQDSWGRYSLDLSTLMKAEPGAIYQVMISFKKQYALYPCEEATSAEVPILAEDNLQQVEATYDQNIWDYYDYYEYDYNSYDWNERDNPCHSSYYTSSRTITRNVLASDLGLIAKAGNDGSILAVVTDLKNAQPLSGATVEVYNFQQKLLATGVSDKDGLVSLKTGQKPFLLTARLQNQLGYLKLDPGISLSLSSFDVSGTEIQQGVKGFIYGERGVWRPGDSLHIAFMLEDKYKTLPAGLPVIFELRNPSGQTIQKQVHNLGASNLFRFSTATPPDAPTGTWMAHIQAGGLTFSKNLKIETVKPNRLAIALDFGSDRLTAENPRVTGNLQVKWLHGAPAPGLRAQFEVDFTKVKTTFEGYANYLFDDQATPFYSEPLPVFDGRLDGSGNAQIPVTLGNNEASPGMLMANFRGKVFEEGGNFSIDQVSIPYYPYTAFAGLQLPATDEWGYLPQKAQKVQLASVSANGAPLSRNLTLSVYQLEWSWWWGGDNGNLDYYLSQQAYNPLLERKVATSNGKGQTDLNIESGGRYYIRVCDQASGHCTGQVIYVGWGNDPSQIPGAAAMLMMSTDKKSYQVGDEVVVQVPGSNQARLLVSIENGSRVLRTFWENLQAGQQSVRFKVTPDMAPNVYVHAALIQPHSQTANDLPMRLYGVVAIQVDDPATRLNPVLSLPDELAPEKPVTIKVTETNKKAMTYTLAVVDEGLLSLTRFQTPSPWNVFYAREALGVRTWDLYDDVIGSFSGKFGKILAIGGDEDGQMQKNAKANRFPPIVRYMGPFRLEPGKTNQHTFTMPRYVGAVRVMVVAGENGAYGHADKSVPVRQALMVLPTLPRVLGPGEQFSLPVQVFAMDAAIKNVTIEVQTDKLLKTTEGNTRQLSFRTTGDQTVYFPVQVEETTGIAKVRVTATSGNQTASYELELDVRNPNPPVTQVVEGIVDAGKQWSGNFTLPGMPGTNKAVLEVSTIPPINLAQRLDYLLSYPYGCIEQTVSSVFPQLLVGNFMELDAATQQRSERNIRAAIQRIQRFQQPDGGLSYWPGNRGNDDWGTTYAYHFLLEASQKGYQVPGDLLNNLKRYQLKSSRDWRKNVAYQRDDLVQAYRLYTLALAGAADQGAMNRLRESGNLTIQAAWRLAAAYQLAGKTDAARQLVQNIGTQIQNYREMAFTYGSALRDEAMILETLALLNDREKGANLVKNVARQLGSGTWLSTQETAYALIALARFAGNDPASTGMKFSFTLPGEQAVSASTGLSIIQKTFKTSGNGQVSVSNQGSGVLFVRILTTGIPARGQETDASKGISLQVQYTDLDGRTIDPASLVQGTDFVASVTVAHTGVSGVYQQLALNQIFPSGWEILNTRLSGAPAMAGSAVPDYQDIRDDRVYTFFSLQPNQRKTFKVRLNATYTGQYYLPAVTCEAMYDQGIMARKAGTYVRVNPLVSQ